VPRAKKQKISQGEAQRLIELARVHTEDAVKALALVAKEGKGSPKVAAALALLHYGWGKPPQLEGMGSPLDNLTDEEVSKEMAAIEKGKSKLPRK
jgi:hypothetical protein